MNIEKVLFPEAYKLKTSKGTIVSLILDEELDPFKVEFDGANCVVINTNKYSYITLSSDKLYYLANLIEEAEEKYEKNHRRQAKLLNKKEIL
jgi:hypothetical protein